MVLSMVMLRLTVDESIPALLILGTFSIDKGDGIENVTFKMNWRFFQLCRVYFNLLKISNVGKFPWS